MTLLGHTVSKSTVLTVIIAIVFLLIVVGIVWLRRHPRKLNVNHCDERWQAAQKLCSKPETWPLAVINADKLLEDVLKKRKYKGKTMGERLMAAQHDIGDNSGVWFGHKLRNKLVHEDMQKLKKKQVMEALIGFREALKDLGALK